MTAMTCLMTEPDVVVATVVFVDSCDPAVPAEVARFGGRVRTRTGAGVMATFDAPSRGIRCMQSLLARGVQMRAGMHAGQLSVYDDDVEGVAVGVAASVMQSAAVGSVLVSRTVAELVAGSGLDLVECGANDELQLLAVR